MSATQSRLGPSTRKSRCTKSGAARASGSRVVVMTHLRRLTPCTRAARMSRATRLRPMWIPWAASSACTRGAPYVPRDSRWMVWIVIVSSASRCVRADGARCCHA